MNSAAAAEAPQIGYIGLGQIGLPMAERLLAGNRLLVHDLDPRAGERLVAAGAIAATAPRDFAQCQAVLLCLPTSEHVKAALIGGPDPLVGHLPKGCLVVDQSSGDPQCSQELAALLDARSLRFADAPISGGPQAAKEGTLAIMLGAQPQDLADATGLLRQISPNITYAGPPGAGQAVKLANNMIAAIQRLVALEGVALATHYGVEAQIAAQIIRQSSGNSFYVERFLAPHITKGRLKQGFSMGLVHKDLQLACSLADRRQVGLLFAPLAKSLYHMGMQEFGAAQEVNAMALLMDRLLSSHVVPEGHDLTEV